MKLTLHIAENKEHNIEWKLDLEGRTEATPREQAFGYYSALLIQSNIHAVLCMMKDLQEIHDKYAAKTEAKPEPKP